MPKDSHDLIGLILGVFAMMMILSLLPLNTILNPNQVINNQASIQGTLNIYSDLGGQNKITLGIGKIERKLNANNKRSINTFFFIYEPPKGFM